MELKDNPGEVANALTSTMNVVKLVSNDEKIFYLNYDVATQSKHLRAQLESEFKEGVTLRYIKISPCRVVKVQNVT